MSSTERYEIHPGHVPEVIKTEPPLVSVGVPVYNGERHIREAIESILAQTLTDFELIISDNASTDATVPICEEYARRDPRIRIERNEQNRGSVYNDNRVLGLARGKYFKWASSNDYVDPRMLEECARVLDQYPDIVVSYCRVGLVDHNGKLTGIESDQYQLDDKSPFVRFRGILHMGLNNAFSGLIRTDVLRSTTYIENYLASDLPVMAELALRGRYHELPETLFFRRMDDDSATVHKSLKDLQEFHDPSTRGRRSMKLWRLHWEYFRVSHRVRIGLRERLRLYAFLARYAYWNRRKLSSEIQAVMIHH